MISLARRYAFPAAPVLLILAAFGLFLPGGRGAASSRAGPQALLSPSSPYDWLQFNGSSINLYMTADQFTDVYHLLQSEAPVFVTALDLFGFEVGAVHTELNLDEGEPPGEGDEDHTQNLAALIRRAKNEEATAVGTGA